MPVPIVTLNWRGKSYRRRNGARDTYVVDGVLTEDAAISAVGIEWGDTFTGDDTMVAEQPTATRIAPLMWEVSVEYVPDPLQLPPRLIWGSGSIAGPTDVSADGIPILNAAGYPLEGASTEVRYKTLTVLTAEEEFDVSESITYENTVNSDDVTIPLTGGKIVYGGQMFCASIGPTTDFDRISLFTPIARTFWMWKGRVQDADGLWDAWKHRLLNASLTGWYYDDDEVAQVGNFVTLTGGQVSSPVLLDALGMPLVNKYKVEARPYVYKIPVPNPDPIDSDLIEVRPKATFLKYLRFLAVPMSSMAIWNPAFPET
jgi:hypothetical protein